MGATRRRELLDNSVFEVIPMKSAAEKAMALPSGATVSVTASPAKGMQATADLAEELAQAGFRVVPHLSARLIKSMTELESLVERLTGFGVDRVFVVGGDADDPGEFFDAPSLIDALHALGDPFPRLGITGYPEGHPFIDDEALMEALVRKAPSASSIATQMCFDVSTIERWARTIRRAGVDLPILAGIPGASDVTKLMTIGARIGVGASLRYLAKNRRALGRLLRPGHFTPDALVTRLAGVHPDLRVDGLHIFTFNQIDDTVEWFRSARGER